MEKQLLDMTRKLEQAKSGGNYEACLIEEYRKPIQLFQLWKTKEYLYEASEEVICRSPVLASNMAVLKAMEGDFEEAKRYLTHTEREPYVHAFTELIMPYLSHEEFKACVKRMLDMDKGRNPQITLTAGRPSVVNGFRDFTAYGDYLNENKEACMEAVESLYGEAAVGVYEIALAEYLYQRNECFEALVLIAGTIPLVENKKDVRCLFAALTLEMYILVMNGQAASAVPLMNNLKKRIEHIGYQSIGHNIEALEIYATMYDGNTEQVNLWMRDLAPDEHTDFNMQDTFRYMIKLRGYLIQEKHTELGALANKLKRLLKLGHRIMDECELNLIYAMSLHDQGLKEEAFDILQEALEAAQANRYDRLIGDEGDRMYRLLYDYRRARGNSPYLKRVMELTRKVGMAHPNYLRVVYKDIDKLSPVELKVLTLMAEEYSNVDIAEQLEITINTVKFHSKNIFRKLSVNSRGQAVAKAKEVGML